jgi:hypothetical protein
MNYSLLIQAPTAEAATKHSVTAHHQMVAGCALDGDPRGTKTGWIGILFSKGK